jgi:hypothetical protein
MKNKTQFLIAILLLLLGGPATLSSCSVAYDGELSGGLDVLNEKSFPISEGKTLRISTSPGDVMVTPWDKNEVYVKVLGNDKAREKMKFEFEGNDEEVVISGKYERKIFSWGSSGIKLRYEVKAPANFNVKVSTSGGDIRVGGITGMVNLKTSGGDVEIRETRGELEISTSGGDISLENPEGRTKASTSGGDIKVENFKGNLITTTSGGDINLNGGNGSILAKTSGGDIKLNYSGSNEGMELATSGGDIDIIVPYDFKASVKLSSSGGDVDCDFTTDNVKTEGKRKLEADINGGGKMVIAKTSGGEINLNKK